MPHHTEQDAADPVEALIDFSTVHRLLNNERTTWEPTVREWSSTAVYS